MSTPQVQMPNFPVLSPGQANGGLMGLQVGQQIASGNLANQLAMIQNQYAPQMTQADLQQKLLSNAMTRAQVPYAGQQAAANLALTQAQGPNIQSQTAMNNATIPLLGYKFMGPYYQALARAQQAQSGIDNTIISMSKTPQGMALIKNNPQYAQAYNDAMNRAAQNERTGWLGNTGSLGLPGGGAPNGNLNFSVTPTVGNSPGSLNTANNGAPNPNAVQPGQYGALQQALSQPGIPQAGNPSMSPGANNNSSAIQAVQNATNDAYLKKYLPTGAQQQITYENVLDNQMRTISPQLQDVASFAGLAGKANQTASKYAQAAGMGASPQYRNFQNFVKVQAPMLANEFRRALGGNPTDKENTMLQDITDPIAWDKDPQQVFSEFNTLVNITRSIGSEITKTPTQAVNTLNQNMTNPPYAQMNSGKVRVISPSGQAGFVPAARAAAYLSNGYRRG